MILARLSFNFNKTCKEPKMKRVLKYLGAKIATGSGIHLFQQRIDLVVVNNLLSTMKYLRFIVTT